MTHSDIRLCALLDGRAAPLDEPDRMALDCIAQGATTLIYQAGSSFRTGLRDVSAIMTAIEGRGASCLVVERVDLASCSGCNGVVLRQADMHPRDARQLLGPDATIAIAISTPAQADELYRLPVDCTVVGAFPDGTGVGVDPDLDAFGRLAFRAHLAAPGIGVVAAAAFGGAPFPHLIGAGADGVACPAVSVLAGAATGSRSLRATIDIALAARGKT